MLSLALAMALATPPPLAAPAPQAAPAPKVARPHGARDGEWTWDAVGKFWWRVRPAASPAVYRPATFALPRGVAACPT